METYFLDLETTGLNPRLDKIRLIQCLNGRDEVNVWDTWKEPET